MTIWDDKKYWKLYPKILPLSVKKNINTKRFVLRVQINENGVDVVDQPVVALVVDVDIDDLEAAGGQDPGPRVHTNRTLILQPGDLAYG